MLLCLKSDVIILYATRCWWMLLYCVSFSLVHISSVTLLSKESLLDFVSSVFSSVTILLFRLAQTWSNVEIWKVISSEVVWEREMWLIYDNLDRRQLCFQKDSAWLWNTNSHIQSVNYLDLFFGMYGIDVGWLQTPPAPALTHSLWVYVQECEWM